MMHKKRTGQWEMREEVAGAQSGRPSIVGLKRGSVTRRDPLAELSANLLKARTAYCDGRFAEAEDDLDRILETLQLAAFSNLPDQESRNRDLLEATASSLAGRIHLWQKEDDQAERLLSTAVDLSDRWFPSIESPSNQVLGDYGVTLWLHGSKERAAPFLEKGVEFQDICPDTYYFLGEYMLEQRRYAEAKLLFNQTLNLAPDYFPAYQALAQTLELLGETSDAAIAYQDAANLVLNDDPDQALTLIDKALELQPESADARMTKGDILRLMDEYDQARIYLQSAIELDEENVGAWFGLGLLFGNIGDLNESLKALNKALELDPGNCYIKIPRAVTLRNLQRIDEALADLRQCAGEDSQIAEAFLELGETLRLQGEYEEALQNIDKALELVPNYAWALGTKGQVLLEIGSPHEALGYLEQALRIDPQLGWAFNELGVAFIELGRNEEALQAFEQALRINPDQNEPLLRTAELMRLNGQVDQALSLIDRALDQFADNVWALTERGLALVELEKYDEALQAFDKALALEPGNSELHQYRAALLSAMGQYEAALAEVDRALELDPESYVAWFNRAELLQWLGRSSEALGAYDKVLAIIPDDIDALRGKGYALLALFRNKEAVYVLRQAAEQDPQNPLLLTDLALAWKYHSNYPLALDSLEKALEFDPENTWALGTLGDVLCEIGEFESAVVMLDRAIAIDHSNYYNFTTKGWALENLGRSRADEARAAYEEGLALKPAFPADLWARKGMANAMRLQGDTDNALALYRSIIKETESKDIVIDVNLLPLVGWCHFQVALYGEQVDHFDSAVRYYIDALSLNSEMLASQFDLALAMMCSGRPSRALEEFNRGLESVMELHPLRQRGLLFVVMDDLQEAMTALPALTKKRECQQVRKKLLTAYDKALSASPPLVGLTKID